LRSTEKIESVAIDRLIPYANNSRKHSDQQIAQIAGSIKEFGFNNPVLIDKEYGIIAGHGRVLAARKLDLKEVPCIRLEHLTETQKKAFIIADNKIALNADWDQELLTIELDALLADGFAMEILGFDSEELKAALDPVTPTEGLTDEDAVPEAPEEPKTKLGDIYQLGRHRLMCGDSTSIDAVEKLIDGQKVDMVFTDPPYGMFLDTDYDSMFAADKAHRKTGKRFNEVVGDHEDFAPELISTIFTAFPDAKEVFIWGADYFSELIPNRKDGSWVVWDKRTNENMDKVSGNTFELCWSKQKHKRLVARILWSGHHGMQKDDTKKRVHPTQKPVELVNWFFEQWGKGCDLIVDLFGGSGSTLIACEKLGRTNFTMELDPKYCDVIVKRWEDFTGKKSNLLTLSEI
jgi:DNA modification methylase